MRSDTHAGRRHQVAPCHERHRDPDRGDAHASRSTVQASHVALAVHVPRAHQRAAPAHADARLARKGLQLRVSAVLPAPERQ